MSHGPDNPYKEQCGCPDCLLEEASITDSASEFAIKITTDKPGDLVAMIADRDADLWRKAQEQMRAKASQHIPWDYGKCSCGFRWRKIDSTNPYGDLQEHIRSIPLDPLPAGDKE